MNKFTLLFLGALAFGGSLLVFTGCVADVGGGGYYRGGGPWYHDGPWMDGGPRVGVGIDLHPPGFRR